VRHKGKVVKPRMFLLGWVRSIRVIGFSIVACLLLASSASAQITFDVNSTDDGVDINPGDGNCSTVAAPALPICTLRAAVMEANRAPNLGAIIKLTSSVVPYTLKIFPHDADGEDNGDLNLLVPSGYVPGPTQIIGDGAATTIIDANGIDRILHIAAGRSVTISGVSLVNGLLASGLSQGGGIYNESSLSLSDCIVSHNAVSYGNGGGIFNGDTLVATRVMLTDNTAQSYGGGIYNNYRLELSQSALSANKAIGGAGIYNAGGFPYNRVDSTGITSNIATLYGGGIANIYSSTPLNITRSTVSNNTAGTKGSGVYNEGVLAMTGSTVSGNKASNGGGLWTSGSLSVTNSTISQNQASLDGGGIYNLGVAKVYNSTIAYNQADNNADGIGDGGGIYVSSGTFEVHNTILAGNRLVFDNSNSDCFGFLVLYGVTGFEGGDQCAGFGAVIVVDSATELGILKDNGGATETIALLPPSSLIGNGAAEECNDADAHHLASDQRGNPRPPILQACDIGAFEYNEVFRSSFDPPLP